MPAQITRPKRRTVNPRVAEITRGLGWFSVAVGVAQIVAPRTVSRMVGFNFHPAFTVLCGLRELACGIGILTQREPKPWVQARVAGDVLDLAVMGAALALPGVDRGRAAIATAAVAGVTALDVYCSRELSSETKPAPRHVRGTVSVNRPAAELYGFWRDFKNLPRVMPHLKSVEVIDSTRSRWSAHAPAGTTIEWESELIDDVPNQRLAWRSLESSDVYNAGSVRFEAAPAGRGTQVVVDLLYDPPGGALGASVAKIFGRDAGQEVRADLRAFKQLMETGEIATTEGQPSGHRGPKKYDRIK